jgi:hypothetical protein
MLATGVCVTAAASIALAPLPTQPLPSTHAAPVVLAGAWQDLQTNVQQDLANLVSTIVHYPPAPILTQVAKNFTTYSHWLVGQDGGDPVKIVQTMGEHLGAAVGVAATLGVMVPLSFIGAFIAPGVMMAQLISDTAKYPSTPLTVLQAFIDAPAVYLNTTFNCCSSAFFQLAFGLLNPGPLGYLVSLGPAIAKALEIPPTPAPEPPAVAAKQPAPVSGVAQSRRARTIAPAPKAVGSRSAKRPDAARKVDANSHRATSNGKGGSARPGNRESR